MLVKLHPQNLNGNFGHFEAKLILHHPFNCWCSFAISHFCLVHLKTIMTETQKLSLISLLCLLVHPKLNL